MAKVRQNPLQHGLDRLKQGMAKVDSTMTSRMPEDLQTAINTRKAKNKPKK